MGLEAVVSGTKQRAESREQRADIQATFSYHHGLKEEIGDANVIKFESQVRKKLTTASRQGGERDLVATVHVEKEGRDFKVAINGNAVIGREAKQLAASSTDRNLLKAGSAAAKAIQKEVRRAKRCVAKP